MFTSNPHHPYSPEFAEHYWSGGASEKTHVFLETNHLPQRFAAVGQGAGAENHFTIAELGFGTALNFLLTAHLWQTSAPPSAHLTYISYELYPLTTAQLQPIHAVFPSYLHALSRQFLTTYNPNPGWNHLELPNITLHLYVGDAASGILTHPYPADCWFLDGFSPANNPQLWLPELFRHVASHTRPGGTASTYSVATRVKKALTVAGFTLTEVSGFPPKRVILSAKKQP